MTRPLNGYTTSVAETRAPRRLTALAFFTLGELLFLSFDPIVAAVPVTSAFLLGAIALTPGKE